MTFTQPFINTVPIPLAARSDSVRVLLVVEGINDVEFLRRIALLLHADNATLPNLAQLERQGQLIFIPFGGGPVGAWTERLAPLGKPEIHLFDQELPPETKSRLAAVEIINNRPLCQAFLTRKRSLENYLHPAAILEVANVEVAFGDFDSVADLVSQKLYSRTGCAPGWESLNRRTRRRLAYRAKRWLNTHAVDQMTFKMLHERDPQGEVRGWLQTIGELAETQSVLGR